MKEKTIPSREEIRAMSAAELNDLHDELEAKIISIRTSLEYDDGDDDWYSRAKGALTVHSIAMAEVQKCLIKFKNPKKNAHDEMSMRQQELAIQKRAQEIEITKENNKVRLIQQETALKKAEFHTIQKNADLIKRTSYLHVFFRTCREELPEELFEKLTTIANEEHIKTIQKELGL